MQRARGRPCARRQKGFRRAIPPTTGTESDRARSVAANTLTDPAPRCVPTFLVAPVPPREPLPEPARTMKTKPLAVLGVTLSLALPTVLNAQSASPSSPPATDTEPGSIVTEAAGVSNDVVTLDAMEVLTSADQGYIAVNALAGGRAKTPIRLTPSVMSSLTRTFIEDVGITDMRESLQWSLNVVPSDPTAGKRFPFGGWDYNFRGAGQSLHGGSGPTRNYFTFYQVADSYNVDRIEFDRGPNSILFGVGTVGGVLNVYTKVPRFDDDFSTIGLTFDDHGSNRVELDFNRVFNERWALRLNALADDDRGWRRRDQDKQHAVDLALTFRPTDRTSFRVEGEISRSVNTIIADTVPDGSSLWNGTTVADTAGAPIEGAGDNPLSVAGAPGVQTINPWNRPSHWAYIPGLADAGIQDYSNAYRSMGTSLPIAPFAGYYPDTMIDTGRDTAHPDASRMPVLPTRDTTFGSGFSEPEYENLSAWLDHRITDSLSVQLSGYRYTDDHEARNYEGLGTWAIDLNRELPDGSANPYFGEAFGEFFLSRQTQSRTVTEGRIQLNHEIDVDLMDVPVHQRFSLAAGTQEITWQARQYNAQLLDTGVEDAALNMVWARLYADQPNLEFDLPDTIGGRPVAYAPMPFDWFDFDETYELQNVSFVSHTRLWQDRLSLLLGARYDDYEHERLGANSGDFISDGAHGTTYSAGAVYYFGWLGLFANYSENFDPIGPGRSPGLDGRALGPARGDGLDYGLRVSTADGRYYASLSRYESTSHNRIGTVYLPIGGIWNNYFEATGEPVDPSLTNISFSDTESLDVTGYEFEITANPTDALRLQASYSKPDSTIVESMPGQRAYFAEFLPTWQAAAQGTSAAAGNLADQLVNAQATLDENLAGRTKTGLVDYTANLFANYTFQDGMFEGFSVGGGIARTGEEYLRSLDGMPLFASARTTTNLVLAYNTTLFDADARIALNIDNLLGEDDIIITGYDGVWTNADGDPINTAYHLPAPRLYRLSLRFTF